MWLDKMPWSHHHIQCYILGSPQEPSCILFIEACVTNILNLHCKLTSWPLLDLTQDLPLQDYDPADYKISAGYLMSPAEKLLDDDASVSLSEYLAGLVSAQTTPMSVSTELGTNPHRDSTSGVTAGPFTTDPATGNGHANNTHTNSNTHTNVDPARSIVVAKVPRYNEWASSPADADIESIDLLDAHAAGYYLDSPPTLDGHGIHKDSP